MTPPVLHATRLGRRIGRWSHGARTALAVALGSLMSQPAAAHVKWFCAFDVAGQPRGLADVLCSDFELLVALAVVALLLGCVLERTPAGTFLVRALDQATSGLAANTETLTRAVCGSFFVALWTSGGILLTPELKTDSAAIPWIQLAIAAGMTSRRTMPLSALGIVALFGLAVRQYGAFHLMDYPVFLGVAAYLTLTALDRTLFGMRPVDVVRWGAAITLMWASVEKWAYPEWTFPLLISDPAMAMGFSPEFFMRAAGVVEFTLAFALVCTPLVRRLAALVLAAMFIGAVFEFGKIDAIGHSAIVAVLLAVVADATPAEPRQFRWRQSLLDPALGYGLALAAFLTLYYATHAALLGTAAA